MLPKHTGEFDLAHAGLAILIVLAFMQWQDRPIQSYRPYDSFQEQERDVNVMDHSYESWLWEDPFKYNPKKTLCKEPSCKKPIDSDQCNDLLKEKPGKKIILPTNSRHHTAEDQETMVRYRYAVVSGLISAGYSANEPDRLHYCTTQSTESDKSKYDIRWEHFSKKGVEDIIVIWFDGYLDKGNEENKKIIKNSFPFTDDEDIETLNPRYNHSDSSLSERPDEELNNSLSLSKNLVEELKIRNIENPSEVMLIAEKNVNNIQNLMNEFCKHFYDPDCQRISNFGYLKGLDSYQRESTKESQDNKIINKPLQKRKEFLIDQHNLPIGPDQFDYLYRLAKQIKESHKDSDPKKHIKAAGVFGSDFYDKLIIFEALRAEIPNIVLFTTDLDAEMLHPQYWRWTRNLIVATPFDLKLKKELQKQIPPFRDSFQTEILYKILELTDNLKMVESQPPPPLIFEIGRNTPIYLSGNKVDSVHPAYDSADQLSKQLWLYFLIAAASILIVHQIKPHSGMLILWLLITSLILFFVLYHAINMVHDEPFTFSDGISMWPTILLRWFVFFLATAFIFQSIRSLEVNFARLTKRYYPGTNLSTLFDDRQPFSFDKLIKLIQERWIEKLTLWKFSSESIMIALVIMVSVSVYVYGIGLYGYNFFPDLVAIILVLIVSGMILFGNKIQSIRDWVEKDATQSENDLWTEYHNLGRLKHRMLRASIKFSIFMMVAALLYQLFPVLPPPCRGAVCDWEHVSRIVSFPVIMLLTFLVLDAQRLCLHWIEKIKTDLIVEKGKVAFPTPESLHTVITLVAKRTKIVDRLIYYPIIAIMLMLAARINYFDNNVFSPHIGFTVILSISLLLYAGVKLRVEAVKLKRAAINSVSNLPRSETVLQEIKAIDYGAFESLFDQPAVRSLLLTLGFLGLIATEFMKLP